MFGDEGTSWPNGPFLIRYDRAVELSGNSNMKFHFFSLARCFIGEKYELRVTVACCIWWHVWNYLQWIHMSDEELDKICQRSFDGDRENYVKKSLMTMEFGFMDLPHWTKYDCQSLSEVTARRVRCNGSGASHSGGRSSSRKKSSRSSSMILCRN